jgi:hypothetical protein
MVDAPQPPAAGGAALRATWPRELPIELYEAVAADVGTHGFSHVFGVEDDAVLLLASGDLVLWRGPGDVVRTPYPAVRRAGARRPRSARTLALVDDVTVTVSAEIADRVQRRADAMPAPDDDTAAPDAVPTVTTLTAAPAPVAAVRPASTAAGRRSGVGARPVPAVLRRACAVTALAPRGYARVETGELVPVTADPAVGVIPIGTQLALRDAAPLAVATALSTENHR